MRRRHEFRPTQIEAYTIKARTKVTPDTRYRVSGAKSPAYNHGIHSGELILPATATRAALQPDAAFRKGESLFFSGEKQRTVLCLVLVLLTLVFYNSAGRNGFVNFDDTIYVTHNPHVRAGLTWDTFRWAFTTFDAANWHPLTWLSHALDFQLFGMNPAGQHYETVLLHALNAVLLFLLLAGATGSIWRSFMVAALFALHPVNVESVAWLSERKNVLSLIFFLLSIHAYDWYVRRESAKRYALVAALFALGLMAKPEIITLPFVLLLWDYWPLRRMATSSKNPSDKDNSSSVPAPRSFSFLVLEKLPLLLLSAASAVVTFFAQRSGEALHRAPAWERFGNVPLAYLGYLEHAFWPVRLAALYPHPGRFLAVSKIAVSTVIVILITAAVLHFRKRRYLVMGWFWLLGTLVPVIGLVQFGVQGMADRYAYLSYIGLFIAVVWGVAEIAGERKISSAWLAIPSAAILLTLGMLTRHQISYWHDSETLWRHTLGITERNFMAHDGLARALAGEGRMDQAAAEFDAAYQLHGYSSSGLIEIGVYEQTHGYAKDAITEYSRAFEEATDSPSRAVALTMLGSAYTQAGDFNHAKASYNAALHENPQNSIALVSSGLLAEREGDYAAAIDLISRAMKLAPTDAGYMLLEQALRKAGHSAEADQARAQAQRLSRDWAKTQATAAQVLASAGIKAE
jgi:protein O-mannosyl-transferase